MGELRLSYPACAIAGKMRLTAEDIALLREQVFVRGLASSQDAEVLLAINGSCGEKCPEWHHYFIEAMTDFIVHSSHPRGAMDAWNADWLIAMISTRGVVNSRIELDLLFHVIDISAQIPDSLSILALEQLRLAITDNVGAWAGLRGGRRHGLLKSDVMLIGRVMSAIARSRGSHLTPRERRMLEQIGVLTGLPDHHVAAA
ncbi:hypothetical protein OIU34_26740 [Pararhizobium sp. BT-229]|uniref:hypothetical protein n=1 Tax=Pararhizobium sp. BT-229 TaxID=2986923 RepID=UPI0021F7B960|nr:hypothetical protein [Pararhizobium sp. BT-229]MCV9965480.1 hypothetical protein [Pararhizobium sp. BT-229]